MVLVLHYKKNRFSFHFVCDHFKWLRDVVRCWSSNIPALITEQLLDYRTCTRLNSVQFTFIHLVSVCYNKLAVFWLCLGADIVLRWARSGQLLCYLIYDQLVE